MSYEKYWEEAVSRASNKLDSLKYGYDNGVDEKREKEAFLSKIDLRFFSPIQNLISRIEKKYLDKNKVFIITKYPSITFCVPNIYNGTKNKYSFCVVNFENDYLGTNFRIATIMKTDDPSFHNSAINDFYQRQEILSLCTNSKLLNLIADNPFFDFEHKKNGSIDLKNLDQYGYNSKYIDKNGFLLIERNFNCEKTPEKIVVEYIEYLIKMLNESRFISVFTPIFEYYKKMNYYRNEYYKVDNELREVNRKIEKLVNPYGY